MVHGSCMNDLQWKQKGHDHGRPMANDLEFLPHHSLLYPFFASPMLLPVFTGSVKGAGRVAHILKAFIAHLGQPLLYRFRLGTGD